MEIRKANTIARKLMRDHGLDGWTLQNDNAKQRFGYCSHAKKVISLSKPLVRLNDEERVTNTILHEIAHALAPRGAGHGTAWKIEMRKLGLAPERCYSNANTVTVKSGLQYKCGKCDFILNRFKRIAPDRLARIYHAKCGGRFTKI